jgi:hypothetical protein
MVGLASDLREVAGESARSRSDGEHCSKFHFDIAMNGTSCAAEHDEHCGFTSLELGEAFHRNA